MFCQGFVKERLMRIMGMYLKMMSQTRNGTDMRNSQRCLQMTLPKCLVLPFAAMFALFSIWPPLRNPQKPAFMAMWFLCILLDVWFDGNSFSA